MKDICFYSSDILLPDPARCDGSRWSCVACDQYTSQPDYWERADALVGDAPSTLRLVLPEVYLAETDARVPVIHATMERYLHDVLVSHPGSMILVRRTLGDGKVRTGLVGAIDLEAYDFRPGSDALIRATEKTVPERIPPRTAIRRGAPVELPHVMLLIDDEQKTVIEPLVACASTYHVAYDHDLMQGGGHITGHFLDTEAQSRVLDALAALITPDAVAARYGKADLAPLLFAVGDGNHSLAAAKTCFEELKAEIGAEAAASHPMRYALCEVVNLYDESLEFEPIYRVVFGVDPHKVAEDFKAYAESLDGDAAPHDILLHSGDIHVTVTVSHPVSALAVGTVQDFFNQYVLPDGAEVDYIHGEDTALALGERGNALCFLFDGMQKNELFSTVISDGSLPRKTFSMGHAEDKRYYTEARRL